MRIKQELGGDTPAWVVTFADLMSLLLCFFVLLLSFSERDVRSTRPRAAVGDEDLQKILGQSVFPQGLSDEDDHPDRFQQRKGDQ